MYMGMGALISTWVWGSNMYMGMGALMSTWVWGLKYVHQYGGSNKYLGFLGSNVYTDWDSYKYLGLRAKICTWVWGL